MREIGRLIVALTLIAVISGLILAVVEGMTREPIAAQRRLEMLKALRAVLPPMDNEPDTDAVTLPVGKDAKGQEVRRTFYRGRQQGALSGVAFKVVSPEGYAGNIEIMVGVDPAGSVTGIEILTQAETPGLGNKISEDWFKAQFRGRSLDNADWRVKKDGGQFDQITGATISPRAVVKAVRGGLEYFRDHRAEIIAPKGT